MLFELLDAMDGVAADADLLFLLTTNRADLLEPALAARPGRVDVAVEIGLPDADSRRRLLGLYGRSVDLELTEEQVADVIEGSEGTTASFVKELLRRSVLEWLEVGARTVTGAHVTRALDDLLELAAGDAGAARRGPRRESHPPTLAAGASGADRASDGRRTGVGRAQPTTYGTGTYR